MNYMKFGNSSLLLLILLLSMFGPISTDMYLAGLPDMIGEFDTDEGMMSMSLYMFILVMALSILITGPLSDKYGRRKVLIASLALYIASCILCCLMTDIHLFILMRMMEAVGSGGALTTAFALIKDCYSGPMLRKTLSITAVIGILGPILSPIIGNGLILLIDWRATFWLPAAIAGICLLIGLGLSSDLPMGRYTGSVAGTLSKVASIMKDGNFTAYMVMTCIFMAVQLGYIAVSAYIFEDMGGSDVYTLSLGAGCIAGLAISTLQMRFVRTGVGHIKVCFVLGLLGFLSFAFLAERSWVLLMMSMFLPSANLTTFRTIGFNILMNSHPGDNGSVSALLNFSTFFFGFVGMVIASSFPRGMFVTGMAIILGGCVIVYAAMWMILRHRGYPLNGMKG